MFAEYVVLLEQTMGFMTATVSGVQAESEQDAIEIAKDHMATPHHWRSVRVVET